MYSPQASILPEDSSPKPKKAIRSTLVSRNITIAGHRTSVRLEPDMWSGLMEACRRERVTLHDMCTKVAHGKSADTSLTAAIRVHVMNYYRMASTEDGHFKAGHGSGMRMSVPTMHTTSQPMGRQTPAAANHQTNHQMQTPPVQRNVTPASPFMIGMSRMNGNGTMR